MEDWGGVFSIPSDKRALKKKIFEGAHIYKNREKRTSPSLSYRLADD